MRLSCWLSALQTQTSVVAPWPSPLRVPAVTTVDLCPAVCQHQLSTTMGMTGGHREATTDMTDLHRKLVQLQIEMMENELQQMEILKRIQTETSLTCKQTYQSRSERALVESIMYLSKCDYFHGSLSWQESWTLLEGCAEGVFLVRRSQSENCQFPYSLSFQRGEKMGGPTSIRIRLCEGRWSLDCQDVLLGRLPTFPDLQSLLRHYVQISAEPKSCLINLSTGLAKSMEPV